MLNKDIQSIKHPTKLLLSGDTCLMSQPALITTVGRVASQFLQQIHYWSVSFSKVGVVEDGIKWIYNTLDDWAAQLKISKRQLQRIITKLKQKGVLLITNLGNSLVKKFGYAINYETLEDLAQGYSTPQKDKSTETPGFPSVDIMSSPCGHNVHTYTKNTAKIIKPLSNNSLIISENHILKKEETCTLNAVTSSQDIRTNEYHHSAAEQKPQELLMKKFVSETPISPKTQKESLQIKVIEAKTEEIFSTEVESSAQSTNLPIVLLEIWNEEIGEHIGKSALTKKRAQFLTSAFQRCFNESKEEWKTFCKDLTTSSFLMGKAKSSFRASLDWVLKFDTIQRVCEGDFGVQRTRRPEKTEITFEIVENKIRSSYDDESVQALRLTLLRNFGFATYLSWFEGTFLSIYETSIEIVVQTAFLCFYIDTHFSWKIEQMTGRKVVCKVRS